MYNTFAKRSDGSLEMFALDYCENCGCLAVGANAVTLCETVEYAEKELGLKRRDDVKADLAYCESLGMVVCALCDTD